MNTLSFKVKTILLGFIYLLLNIPVLHSQEILQECYTSPPPAKVMREYAKKMPAIQDYLKSKTSRNPVTSVLPITFTVFRDPLTNNAPSQDQITESINFINQELAPANIEFVQVGFINYVDNETLSNANAQSYQGSSYGYMFSASNVYVFGEGAGGLAGFPCPVFPISNSPDCEFEDDNKIRVGKVQDNSIDDPIFVHELGHHLGLFHIHMGDPDVDPYSDYQNDDWPAELVIRTDDSNKPFPTPNWPAGGDLLEDTEASCVAGPNCNYDINCNYIGTTLTDQNLDPFTPNVDNYMGYFNLCLSEFTPQQIGQLDVNGEYRANKYANAGNYPGYMTDFVQFEGTEVEWPGVVTQLDFPENGTYSNSTSQSDGIFQLEIYTNEAVTIRAARLPPIDGFITEFEYSQPEWVAGVSSFDIVLIQRHILNILPLPNGYKKLAADVDQNGSISTLDMLEIKKLILVITDRFGNSIDGPYYPWYFIPEFIPQDNATAFDNNPFDLGITPSGPIVFPDYVNPFWSYDIVDVNNGKNGFDGIKLGDVNSSSPPMPPGFTSENPGEGESMCNPGTEVLVPAISLRAGEEIDLQLTVSNYQDIVAFQLGFAIDEETIEIINLQNGDLEGFEFDLHKKQFRKNTNAFRSLYVSSNGLPENLHDESALYGIRVKAKQAIRDLSEVLKLDNKVLESAFYLESGCKAKVDLELVPQAKSRSEQKAVDKYFSEDIQPHPNPFNDFLNIKFLAKKEANYTVVIQDLNGKSVWNTKKLFQKGVNIFNVEDVSSLPGGVFIISIQEQDGAKQYGKIVKAK